MTLEFSSNVKKVKLTKSGFLEATLKFGKLKRVSINLNKCIGNNDGEFDLDGSNFIESGKWFAVKKYQSSYILRGHLTKADGFFTNISEIDLDKVVVIKDRELRCRTRMSSRRRPENLSPRRRRKKEVNIYVNTPNAEGIDEAMYLSQCNIL